MNRRIILKPSGASESQLKQLRELLSAAVTFQKRLADQSAHILRLVSDLQEDDASFFVEHEPASALFHVPDIFDIASPGASEDLLLSTATALYDALRPAHDAEQSIRAHGGICPGVVVESADKTIQLTDFGFASAVCKALGVEPYLQLAVGPPLDRRNDHATGIWEILDSDEVEHDNRIFSFVSVEKYSDPDNLKSFEAASDVYSTAVLLHVLAEHRHFPPLGPGDHRLGYMRQAIGTLPYGGRRRPDLGKSSEPAVKCWCELIAKNLNHDPLHRYSAQDALKKFAEVGQKPIDHSALRHQQLEAELSKFLAAAPIEKMNWAQAWDKYLPYRKDDSLTKSLREKVETVLLRAEAHTSLDRAESRLSTNEWPRAEEEAWRVSAMQGLPHELVERARRLDECLRESRAVAEEIEQIEAIRREAEPADPARALQDMDELLERIERQSPDAMIATAVRGYRKRIVEQLERRKQELVKLIKQHREQKKQIEDWLDDLQKLADGETWGPFEEQIKKTPEPAIAQWPKDLRQKKDVLQKRLDDYRASQAWVASLRTCLETKHWNKANALVAAKPALTYWPPKQTKDADEIIRRIRVEQERIKQENDAHQWVAKLKAAVERADWPGAQKVLDERPSIVHWPEEVIELETECQKLLNKHYSEKELLEKWIARLHHLEQQPKGWLDALELIKRPPITPLPEASRLAAEKVAERCRKKQKELEDADLRQREQRVVEAARRLVIDVVIRRWSDYVSADHVGVEAGKVEWQEKSKSAGQVRTTSTLRFGPESTDTAPFKGTLGFELADDQPTWMEPEVLENRLGEWVTQQLLKAQQARMGELFAAVREGPLARAAVQCGLEKPALQAQVKVLLKMGGGRTETIPGLASWSSRDLSWALQDTPILARETRRIMAQEAVARLREKVPADCTFVRPYTSALVFDSLTEGPVAWAEVARTLSIPVRVALRLSGSNPPVALQTITVSFPRPGEALDNSDIRQIEAELSKAVVAAQQESLRATLDQAKGRCSGSSVKIEVSAKPLTIKRPVEGLRLDITAKKHKPLTLSAAWSPSAFGFVLETGWEARLHDFLQGVQPSVLQPDVPKPSKTELIQQGPHPKGKATRPPEPPGIPWWRKIAGIAAVLLAMATVGLFVMRDDPSDAFKSAISNQSENTNLIQDENDNQSDPVPNPAQTPLIDPGQPPKPEPEPLPHREPTLELVNVALQELQKPLGRLVDPDSLKDWVSETEGGETWKVSIPGLTNSIIAIKPTIGADGKAALSTEDAGRLKESVEELRTLLSLPDSYNINLDDNEVWTQALSSFDQDWIDPKQILVNVSPTSWTVSDDSWIMTSLPGSILFKDRPDKLGTVKVQLKAQEEKIHPNLEETAAVLVQRIEEAIERYEVESKEWLNNCMTCLFTKQEVKEDESESEPVQPDVDGLPVLSWTVRGGGLLDRKLVARWDVAKLEYQWHDGSEERAEIALEVAMFLASLNAELALLKEDHWFKQAGINPLNVFEVEEPTDDVWVLGVKAPWTVETTEGGDEERSETLPFNEALPIEIVWDPDNESSLLDRIKTTEPKSLLMDAEPQSYWPLVAAYAQWSDDPAAELKETLGSTAQPASQYVNLTVEFKREPPTADWSVTFPTTPTVVKFNITVSKELIKGVAGISDDELERQWNESLLTKFSTHDVVVNQTGVATITPLEELVQALAWRPSPPDDESLAKSDSEPVPTPPVDESPRAQAENFLATKVGTLNDNDAFEVMEKICTGKGLTLPGDVADFISLTQRLSNPMLNKGGQDIPATVFVEYFCGPSKFFALVWTDNQGASLLLLGEKSLLSTPSGGNLLQPVLDAAQGALCRSTDGEKAKLGILVGLDEDISKRDFLKLRVTVEPCDYARLPGPAGYTNSVSWTSLNAMIGGELGNRMCDYEIFDISLSKRLVSAGQ